LNEFWERLSERERRLALVTLGVVILAACVGVTVKAAGHVRDLNRTIDRREQDLLNYRMQEARGVSVDRAFAEVAAQHSSAWTENEIHNRLREEIYRLQLEDENAPESAKKLVEIPRLLQGTLKDTGEGYREYQLTIKIPATDIYSLILFLMRLQQSPQSLRIDGLEIARPAESQLLAVTINVTRTVVAGAPTGEAETVAAKPQATVASWDGGRAEDWQAPHADLALVSEVGELAADGGSCLRAQATAPDASAYMVQELETAITYDFVVDAAANGAAMLQVVNDADGQAFEGIQALPDDGRMYRYHVAFTVPGEPGGSVKIRVPAIIMKSPRTQVYVDNVELRRAME
jgi:hypothetical protein